MSKHTLSKKSRYSILKLSGFRARMATTQGRKTLRNRRKNVIFCKSNLKKKSVFLTLQSILFPGKSNPLQKPPSEKIKVFF